MSETVNVDAMTRIFRYHNLKLEDPDILKSPEEIKDFYCTLYPELTQAVIEGPEYQGKTIVYTFVRSVGTKGGEEPVTSQPITLERIAKKGLTGCVENQTAREEGRCLTQGEANQLYTIINSWGVPILPASSFLPPLP